MDEVQYIGESLTIYNLGHILIFLSFVAAGFSAFSYLKDTLYLKQNNVSSSWKTIGRFSFLLHGLSIYTVIAMIFFAMGNEMYEYYYVFQHVNSELPKEYIFSAFWEGQEGSFMLWMFWHVFLGIVLMAKAGKWESPVLMVIALAQVLINLMILGVHIEIGDFIGKIGVNPIVLLRDSIEAPIFSNSDYLSLIEGQGLNPLLQNYWNVIHPPVLFLGFASIIVPFGFAIGGLVTGWHKEWLEPSFKWALFSASIFGIGILMGGAWAYEALSFGGYWAWDPVENSSFVPWITMVAGVHTHMIAKKTGYSVRSTYLFYILSFVLVLYSTFLTRSGILGDTSVHAFTEMGLENQLLILVGTFAFLGFGLLIYRYKSIPEPKREESIYSREFWMFIGSLVLLFSALLIIGATSLPVYNKIVQIFDPAYEGVVIQDAVAHYDRYQIWIGVFVGLLSGFSIYMRYRSLPIKSERWKKLGLYIGGSALMSLLFIGLTEMWIDLKGWQFYLLCFSGYFTLFSNFSYLFSVGKRDGRMVAAAISHMGFGLLLIGVLSSGHNKGHLTRTSLTAEEFEENKELKDLTFLIEGFPRRIDNYEFIYQSDTIIDRSRVFEIDMKKYASDGAIEEEYTIYPSALMDNKKQKIMSFIPETKHYFGEDIFSVVRAVPPSKSDAEQARSLEDSLNYITYNVAIGDTFSTPTYKGRLESITFQPDNINFNPENSDFAVAANIVFDNPDVDTSYYVQPVLSLDNALIITIADQINDLQLKVRINDTFMNEMVLSGEDLDYQTETVKAGEVFEYQGHQLMLAGFNDKPTNRLYQKQEGDIAVAGRMVIDNEIEIEPIFLIRGGKPMHYNEFIPSKGLHIRFVNIDPKEETFTFLLGKQRIKPGLIVPIDIAEEAGRTDWIYLETRVFPGINLFWLGCLMMMGGFMWSLVSRIMSKRNA